MTAGRAATRSEAAGFTSYQSNFNLQITPYGDTRPNFSSNQVASFIQDNFAMWLSECHVDGFRWDSVYTLTHGNDNSYIPAAGNLVNAINAMIHTNYTGKISIAEDVYNHLGFRQFMGHRATRTLSRRC